MNTLPSKPQKHTTKESLDAAFSEMYEAAIIGSLLLEPERFAQVKAQLNPDDLTSEKHELIYQAMIYLDEHGEPLDWPMIYARIAEPLRAYGGAVVFGDLTTGVWKGMELEPYLKKVKEHSTLLKAARQLSALNDQAFDTPQELFSEVKERVLSCDDLDSEQSYQKAPQISRDVKTQLIEQKAGRAKGYTTGLDRLDRLTQGFHNGEYIVIGGRSSHGKTTLLRQSALRNAAAGIPVFIASHEMKRTQIMELMLPSISGVPYNHIRDVSLRSDADQRRLEGAVDGLGELSFIIDDASNLTARQWCDRIKRAVSEGARICYFDYLQLIADPKAKSIYERVTNCSGLFRNLAKQLDIPIVMFSQMRRPDDRKDTDPPTLYELKESGSIESDAHLVLLVFREKDKQGNWTGADTIEIAKQRFGPSGIFVPVHFNTESLEFFERERT